MQLTVKPPSGARYTEDLDGIHLTLQGLAETRPPRPRLAVVALPFLGLGFFFAFGSMVAGPVGLNEPTLSKLAVCVAMVWGAWKVLRTEAPARLSPVVRLTLTPTTLTIAAAGQSQQVYISDIEDLKHATRTLMLYSGEELDFAPEQPHQIQLWALSIIEPWLARHRHRQGSDDDVPHAIQALQQREEP